jgi:hypothetical protein
MNSIMRHLRCTLLPTLALALGLAFVLVGCRTDAPTLPDSVVDADSPPDLVALLVDLLPAVERLSGLDRVAVLRMRRQSSEDARRYVESRLDAEMPPDRLAGIQRTYAALGLVADTLDLRSLLLDLYTEQVLGYYDPATATLYVLEGEDAAGLRPLLAHELVHALQDQHADLDSLVAWDRGNDRQAAAHAALEGHAMVVMFAVLAEEASRRRIDPVTLPDPSVELAAALQAQNEAFPVFGGAPEIIQETLLFPYVYGARFVHQLWNSMAPMERYPAPLDTLLPASTAQVMIPGRFIESRTAPVELEFDPPAAGWTIVYENTFGMLETSIALGVHGGDAARAAASGWAGDRLRLVAGHGAAVLYWISAWHSEGQAARFAQTLGRTPAATTWQISVGDVEGRPAVRVVIGDVASAGDAALAGAAFPHARIRPAPQPPVAGSAPAVGRPAR